MHDSLLHELRKGLAGLDLKIDDLSLTVKNLEKKIDINTNRLNKIGTQLAYLEDDAPTKEKFDALESRVSKVESKIALA